MISGDINLVLGDDVSDEIVMTSSGLLKAGLFSVLNSIECGSDVKVFGLKESSQPPPLISEAHGQHEGQGLHQAGVCLCGGQEKS